jgi:hypothetical protein
MHGATGILIKLAVRLVVFTAVFWFAARKNPKVVIDRKWATPMIALVFAVLNTALYWALSPVFKLATLGMIGLAMPLVINAALLYGTVRIFSMPRLLGTKIDEAGKTTTARKPLIRIDSMMGMLWMALVLTLAHGACWFALDYLPNR